jgi:glycosyltransferase involved in cell wall biosynthesis
LLRFDRPGQNLAELDGREVVNGDVGSFGGDRAIAVSARVISFHHRLGGMLGHRYSEAFGLQRAVKQRGWDFVLLVREDASDEVRADLPGAHAVLHCPVFRSDLSFDERTADFVAMLHRHLDPIVQCDDWLLITTGTQCETRALATWLAETPAGKRPWTLVVYHSDRWNRGGPQERERQIEEFRATAAALARLDGDAARRLLIAAVVEELCRELRALLGLGILYFPHMTSSEYVAPRKRVAGQPAVVGFPGGARREKGSHLIPAIVAETRKLGRIDFAVQIANEDLSPPALEELCRLDGQPDVRVTHGPLDFAAYNSFLAQCDLVLLPYERTSYRARASGPFIEACVIGRPVVVPAGTWMADQVVAGDAAGLCYEADGPAAIAATVVRAAASLPDLTALARGHAPAWQRPRTCDAFLDWLGHEIGRRGQDRS